MTVNPEAIPAARSASRFNESENRHPCSVGSVKALCRVHSGMQSEEAPPKFNPVWEPTL
jgi:hypothetical protein